MGKKQTFNSLPPGDYSVESMPVDAGSGGGGKILSELPEGDYSVQKSPITKSYQVFKPSVVDQTNPDQLENTLNDIDKTTKGGGGISEYDRELLTKILTDPTTTPQEAKDAVMTIQGYHPKQKDYEYNSLYYVKNENGKLKPVPLAVGERPPEGYDVARMFGSDKSASDDAWYTSFAKGIYNGALIAAEGAAATAQQLNMLVSDEESAYLNKIRNAADNMKIQKDPALNKSLMNLEGVDEFSDLLDKDRYDLSPAAINGTLNSLVESLSATLVGGRFASKAGLGAKASAVFGSYLTQLGDNLDKNREMGLDPRDAAAFSGFQTGAMALLDALGPESAILGKTNSAAKNELFKKLASNLEVDDLGRITKESFAKMAAEFPETYVTTMSQMAKEFAKDVAIETTTEGGQEFVRRSAEQLWDKLSNDDKAKFGTDVTSPESFGAYMESLLAGAIGAGPLSAASARSKAKFENESRSVFETVKKGDAAVVELKENLKIARDAGKLSEQEFKNADFKVDAFNNYYQQAKDLEGLDDAKKKELLELSFNIDALKAETDFSNEDLDKLDPIAKGKINVKKDLIKELQKSVDQIVKENEVQVETIVPDSMVEQMAKAQEKAKGGKSLQDLINTYKPGASKDVVPTQKPKERAKISDFDTDGFNKLSYQNPMEAKKIVQEALKTTENNEMPVTIRSGQNGVLTLDIGDNKQVRLAQSVQVEGLPSFLRVENIGGNKIEVDNRGGDANLENPAMKEFYYDTPAVLKRVEIDQFDKEGNPVVDKDGKQMRKAVLPVYNKETGKFIGFQREHRRGESKYTPMEQEQLAQITESNFLTDEIAPFLYKEDKGKYSPDMARPKSAPKERPIVARPVLLEALEQAKRDLEVEINSEFGNPDNIQAIQNEIADIEEQLKPKIRKAAKEKQAPETKTKPAVKPVEASLPFIKDVKALQQTVTTEQDSEFKGERVKAAKVQAAIRKKLGILEQLSKCVNS